MNRDELGQLMDEQALLKARCDKLYAQQSRDKQSILALYNNLSTGLDPAGTWLNDGIALLTRIHQVRENLHSVQGRLAELQRLIGLP
jgi:hypothetical protein